MNDKCKNAIKKLQTATKAIKYNQSLDLKELMLGSPKEYLKLFHYLFLDYSPAIANEILTKHNMELSSKNDKLFIDGIYKLCRDMFKYVPKLTKDQFFQTNYAAVKAIMAAEIVELMQTKAKSYHQATTTSLASHSSFPTSSSNGMIANSQQSTRQLKDTLSLAQNIVETPTLLSKECKEKVIKVVTSSKISKSNIKTNPKESQPMTITANFNLNHEPIQNLIDDRDAVSSISDIESTNSSNNPPNHLLNDLNEKIGTLTSKLDELLDRVNRIECMTSKSGANSLGSPVIQQAPHANLHDVDSLNKKLENLMNRMFLLENENLLLKQTINNRSTKQANSNWMSGNGHTNANETNAFRNNSEDQNESKYETPFHSFLNISSNQTADESNESLQLEQTSIFTKKTPPQQTAYRLSNGKESGLIEQGVAYEVEQISDNLDNLSINSNESTPTMTEDKEKKLSSKLVDSQNDELFRAKQLVIRASQLNEVLTNQFKL